MTATPKAATSGRSNDALWAVLGLAGLVAITYLYTAPQMQALKDARAASLARQQDNQDIQAQIAQVGHSSLRASKQRSRSWDSRRRSERQPTSYWWPCRQLRVSRVSSCCRCSRLGQMLLRPVP